MLRENTSDIQGATGIKTTLNGSQGHVSARTVASVSMMDTSLQRLYANLRKFNYRHKDLLTCMTLDVENCHSTVYYKQGNTSMQQCRILEVIRRSNERGGKTGDKLGCILPYKQAILVSHT